MALHVYYMLRVSLVRCKHEALKKLYFKSIIKCFKRVKIEKWPDSPYSFPLIDYCVRINGQPTVYSVVIFSHRFLDSDCINFKTFAFLATYWPFWTSLYQGVIITPWLYNTDIKVKKKINRSSTMLNNVFNPWTSNQWKKVQFNCASVPGK